MKSKIYSQVSHKVKDMMTFKTEPSITHDDIEQDIDDLKELLLETEAIGTKIPQSQKLPNEMRTDRPDLKYKDDEEINIVTDYRLLCSK